MCPPPQDPAYEAISFTAQLIAHYTPQGIAVGHTPTFCCGAFYGPVKVDAILHLIDRKTGEALPDKNPTRIAQGQSALVRLVPSAHQGLQRLCVEPYALYGSLGAFAFLDRHRSVLCCCCAVVVVPCASAVLIDWEL